jgi:uncharacterized protein (TIGR02271 family)
MKSKGSLVDNNYSNLSISGGMDVVGADDEKVGTVAELQGAFLIVSKGFFFPTDYYIPTTAVSTVDGNKVYLNVTKDEALNQGWDMVPEATTTTTAYQDQPIVDPGLRIDNPVQTGSQDVSYDSAFTDQVDSNSDTVNVALTEEELTARTRSVERGSVQVDKIVTAEEQTLEVPVTEERIHVTRRVVDRDVRAGDETFEEGTIEVPLRGEEVEIEKRARVREEIEIGKEQVTSTERVSDTVRREDIRISSDGDTVMEDVDAIDEADRPNR